MAKSTSIYRGVYFDSKRGKWKAAGKLGNKMISIGLYKNEGAAARAYDLWAYRNGKSDSFKNQAISRIAIRSNIPIHYKGTIIEVVIDDSRWEALALYNWSIVGGYATTGKRIEPGAFRSKLHYCILGQPIDNRVVDHINRDIFDNRIDNLRFATMSQNSMNRGIHSTFRKTSRFKGVSKSSSSKKPRWQVLASDKYIGYFDDEEKAARAYDAYVLEHWGEFAATNESLGLFNTTEQ